MQQRMEADMVVNAMVARYRGVESAVQRSALVSPEAAKAWIEQGRGPLLCLQVLFSSRYL
jgi:hypothetical protein